MRFVTPAAGDGKLLPFAKPKDWDEAANGPCGTLMVRRQVEGAGPTAFLGLYSNWKPTADELAKLNAGHVVELMCCGVQPAVSVGVVPCADPDPEVRAPERPMAAIRGAVARGMSNTTDPNTEFDSTLAEAVSQEIATLFGVPV